MACFRVDPQPCGYSKYISLLYLFFYPFEPSDSWLILNPPPQKKKKFPKCVCLGLTIRMGIGEKSFLKRSAPEIPKIPKNLPSCGFRRRKRAMTSPATFRPEVRSHFSPKDDTGDTGCVIDRHIRQPSMQ